MNTHPNSKLLRSRLFTLRVTQEHTTQEPLEIEEASTAEDEDNTQETRQTIADTTLATQVNPFKV